MPTTQVNIQTRADLAALQLTAKSFNVLSQQEQLAERQTLALAQQMARLDASMKQPAAGAARLRAALANATYIDPSQGIQALSQITQLEKQATVEAEKLAKATKGLGTNNGLQVLPRTLAGLSGSAADVAKGFLTIQAVEKGFQFVKTGAEVADVTTSFTNLSKAAGTTGQTLLTSLRAASNSTITDAALIKSANLGLLLTQGRIAKDLPQLTQIAQASAKATGQSVDFVFESLVKGISRGSAKIIDNAGITLDGEKAYADYAKSIGKTSDQLTKAEQQQAVLNAVLKDGNDIVKQAGINADDASVRIAQAQTAVQNLLNTLATKAAPGASAVATGVTNLINTGGVAPGAVAEGSAVNAKLVNQAQSYQAYADSVQRTNQQLQDSFKGDPLLGFYARARLGLDTLTPAQFAYAQSLIQTGTASQTALTQAQGLSDVSDKFTRALNSATTAALGNRTELTALAPKILDVANQSDHNRTAVNGLLTAYAEGRQSLPGLVAALDSLSQAHDIARLAAQEEERENRRLGISFGNLVPQVRAAADAIAGLNKAPLPHIADTSDGSIGGGVGGLGDKFTKGFDAVAKAQADADRRAVQLADVQFENRLKKAKDNAEKIRLLQQREAQTSDPIERARIEGQIIDLQNQKNTAVSKELSLQEGIYDSINKQKDALLDIEELTIKGRQADRDAAQKDAEARRVIAATEGRTDARALDLRARALDVIALDDVEKRKRTQEIAEKQATAGGAIVGGRVLQSVPGSGAVPTATGPITPAGVVAAPQAAPPATSGGAYTINLVVDGKTLASVSEPYIMDSLMKAVQTAKARAGA